MLASDHIVLIYSGSVLSELVTVFLEGVFWCFQKLTSQFGRGLAGFLPFPAFKL